MISLKKIFEKLNENSQSDWNPSMTKKDIIQLELECEKIKSLGQNNYRQLG